MKTMATKKISEQVQRLLPQSKTTVKARPPSDRPLSPFPSISIPSPPPIDEIETVKVLDSKSQIASSDIDGQLGYSGSVDFENMEVQDLKLEINKLGLDCVFCFSREDLIERLRNGLT